MISFQLKIASKVPGKAEMKFPVDFLQKMLLKQKVELRLGREVTIEDIRECKPDAVIVASGSSPIVAKSYANSGVKILSAWDALMGGDTGEKCVIVGGGMIGCETAEYLASQKRKITIVERGNDIARELGLIRKSLLRRRLLEYNVDIYLNSIVEKVEDGKVLITGGEQIVTESIIFAVGNQSDNGMVKAIRDIDCEVYHVGDCVKPGDLLDAVHGAFSVARQV